MEEVFIRVTHKEDTRARALTHTHTLPTHTHRERERETHTHTHGHGHGHGHSYTPTRSQHTLITQVSGTTMEEVFIRVTHEEDPRRASLAQLSSSAQPSSRIAATTPAVCWRAIPKLCCMVQQISF